ncbi:MAG: ABC transporter ATP-binding protein [Ferrovibrio sp.]|uniref:ABC transporter ATP-binding protein n=1 Tax=Ferrovibrio sp. TaxID=1917215 RepID=UPI002627EEFE|nr:ABC transporter ATP-binding protein [Ferrovibrio sp.]MCW0236320.1 ABC transporter ATP-binding protein [Ferrovibrio sp.]
MSDAMVQNSPETVQPVLSVRNLKVSFEGPKGRAVAVDNISFDVRPGEMLALVGESGCGKSTVALSLMKLLASPPAIIEGSVYVKGREIFNLSKEEISKVRGKEMAMIFQQPMTSLNPVLTIERQLTEGLMLHEGLTRKQARERARENLDLVGIPSANERLNQYPHQLSGGMRQRVMIAMAMSCKPSILIADEPTTALDVTTQAQILALMSGLQDEFGISTILITHDLGVVAETANRVAVMYAGRIVETATSNDLFSNPSHPYTRGLLGAVPRLDALLSGDDMPSRLREIPGNVPSAGPAVPGCPFAPRCDRVKDRCHTQRPTPVELAPGHIVSCWEYA